MRKVEEVEEVEGVVNVNVNDRGTEEQARKDELR